MASVLLPVGDGRIERYTLAEPMDFACPANLPMPRLAYAAAHVVADPLADVDPWEQTALDWEATLAYRRYLWDLGLGVAEAMDTAQRGSGLHWEAARELIGRSVAEAKAYGAGALLACGVGTDQLAADQAPALVDVLDAYEEQCDAVEALGGRIILMASRALAACARSADDYALVYDRILDQVGSPVIIHWLGEMFDPALAGYWGREDHWAAMEVCLEVIERHSDRVDGVKVSLLSAEKEIAMRRRLPAGVRMYTGDDFNYADLIAGDAEGHSDALLGIFDAIAPAASAALRSMGAGDMERYSSYLAPTVALSRHIFRAPTRYYKTGVVFMSYLNGHQDHFAMVAGQHSARSALHLAEVVRLADAAGLLRDPDLAARRAADFMRLHGVGE